MTGDDSNCDGTPNGGCTCVEGTTIPCGPETDNGICQHGTSTCRNGGFGACEGAVFAGRRDCSSPQDNDCDGLPDNTIIDLQSATTHACFLTGAGGAFQGGAEAVSLSKSTGTWRGWAVILVKRHWSGAARCMLMPSTSDAFVTQFNTPSPLALDSSRTGACYRTFLCGDFGAEGDFVQTEWNGSGWEFDRQVGGTRSLRGAAVCFGRNDETGVPAL
ncbi:MAG TPA: hypothetical protein VG963_06490 [Polyangiaceae bacterium]|nr:hypothetical protein [Polyangiaceae bacterium]